MKPLDIDPVNLFIVVKVPATVFFTKEILPSAIPYPNYIGPSSNPFRGFS